jgi:hypothetical protein
MEAREEIDVNIPRAKCAIVGEFEDRKAADGAVEALLAKGFTDDQLSVVARGAGSDGGEFRPGALMVTARCSGNEDEAERIMRQFLARSVRRDEVSATGEVDET